MSDYETIRREGLQALGQGWHAWSEIVPEEKARGANIVAQCRFYRLDLDGAINVNAHKRGTYGNGVGRVVRRRASGEPRAIGDWQNGLRRTGCETIAEAIEKALRDARRNPDTAAWFPKPPRQRSLCL